MEKASENGIYETGNAIGFCVIEPAGGTYNFIRRIFSCSRQPYRQIINKEWDQVELTKNRLTTSILKASKYIQFTIDDDFNIPDSREDVDKVIMSRGNVIVENTDVLEGRIVVSGIVVFKILYQSASGEEDSDSDKGDVPVVCFESEIPFEESVVVEDPHEEIKPGDRVDGTYTLEDLYITVINSRKIEVRGLVGMKLAVYDRASIEAAVDVANASGISCCYKKFSCTNMVTSCKDMIKVKEEIQLPASKPNINRLIWDEVSFRKFDMKPMNGSISVSFEMELFAIYKGEEEGTPLSFVNVTKEINSSIECPGVYEDMILDGFVTPGKGNVTVKQDSDGEDRIIYVEYNLAAEARVYEDRDINILEDMFSGTANIEPVREEFRYETLRVKNNARTKITRKERLKSSAPGILQILFVCGDCDIDSVKLMDDHIEISGAVRAYIVYVSNDDTRPIFQIEAVLPYTYNVETVQLKDDDSVRITPGVDAITADLINNDEVEIKCVVAMDVTAFARNSCSLITDTKILPVDMDKKAAVPGITGYVVKEGDTVYNLARTYYSSVDSIIKMNNLGEGDIKTGDRIIIVKCP